MSELSRAGGSRELPGPVASTEVEPNRLLVAGGSHYTEFPTLIVGSINEAAGEKVASLATLTHRQFPSGELHCAYDANVRGAHLFNVMTVAQEEGWSPNDALVQLALMNDAARRASVKEITNVLPIYPYSRQDKKDRPRVPISAKVVANFLFNEEWGADRAIAIDLHSDQIQGYTDMPFDHLYAREYLMDATKEEINKIGNPNVSVLAADEGRVKVAGAWQRALGSKFALIHKNRTHGEDTVDVNALVGEVEGCTVVLVDDMLDTAGTMIEDAKKAKEYGAEAIIIVVSHGLFSGPAIARIDAAAELGVIHKVIATDSYENKTLREEKPWFRQVSIAPLLGKVILDVYQLGSVTQHFPND